MTTLVLSKNDATCRAVHAVARATGAIRKGALRLFEVDDSVLTALGASNRPPLLQPTPVEGSDVTTIYRVLCRSGGLEKVMIDEDQEENLEYVGLCQRYQYVLPGEEALALSTSLLYRTFLLGKSHLSLADVICWTSVCPYLHNATVEQLQSLTPLVRWHDHLREVVGLEIFPETPSLRDRLLAAKAGDDERGKKAAGESPSAGQKKKAARGAAPAQPATPSRPLNDPTRLELRVGRIIEVWDHPEADGLYCEKIDIGEEKPREIASGLRKYVSREKMENALVVVFANLKARALRGFMSHGMVLCASDEGHTRIELMHPPEGAKPGDLIQFEGLTGEHEAVLSNKKGAEALPAILPHLKSNEKCQGLYKDDHGHTHVLHIGGRPIWCESLVNASLS